MAEHLSEPGGSPYRMIRRVVRGRRPPEDLRTVVKIDRRTKAGKDAAALRQALIAHCGGAPSATQRAMIEVAVQLRLRLLVMDARFAERGEQSAHDSRQYLAWVNSLSRHLTRLGFEPVAPGPLSLDEQLDAIQGLVSPKDAEHAA